MNEIGGYFEFEKLVSKAYYNDLVLLNTARNALVYLCKARKITKIKIPYYLCDSVSNVLKRENIQYSYYHINEDFLPNFNFCLEKDEYLYLVNYYGQLSDKKIQEIHSKVNCVIFDYTHAFFQKPIIGIDTIYSCRKFFGIPDGAYLSTDSKLVEVLKKDQSKDRMTHLLGRFEGNASDYYSDFKKNDEIFEQEPLKQMSKLTQNILGAIDYNFVLKKRTENYCYLKEALDNYNRIIPKVIKGAFAYPFYCDNGDAVRQTLAEEKIYIPTLWPNVIKMTNNESIENRFARNILPIPCDQRYGKDQIEFVKRELLKCIT